MPDSVTIKAPAKINLFLKVLGKRPDEFHEIISLIQAVNLYDVISISKTKSGIRLHCDHPDLPSDSSNLAWRAADLILERSGIRGGLDIVLEKKIPFGSGLGGGSSDAAAVMKAVNSLFELKLPNTQLAAWGAELGSDVPFFFSNGAALVTGRGEIVKGVEIFSDYVVTLVVPNFHISTKDAYGSLKYYLTNHSRKIDINHKVLGENFYETLNRIGNDLQAFAVAKHPDLESCLHVLHRGGAKYVAMTGSGSAVFGLFERPPSTDLTTIVSNTYGWMLFFLTPVRLSHD